MPKPIQAEGAPARGWAAGSKNWPAGLSFSWGCFWPFKSSWETPEKEDQKGNQGAEMLWAQGTQRRLGPQKAEGKRRRRLAWQAVCGIGKLGPSGLP